MFTIIRSVDTKALLEDYREFRCGLMSTLITTLGKCERVMETFGDLSIRMNDLTKNVNLVIQSFKARDVNFVNNQGELIGLLKQHVEIATLRLGLEHSDLGAYSSLRKGLIHMLNNVPTVNGKERRPKKEYEALVRHLKAIIRELDNLETQGRIDEIIDGLIRTGFPVSGSPG